MSTLKLIKNGKIIQRSKFDWEKNFAMWKLRGWELLENKPVAEDISEEDKPKKTRKKKD